MVAFIAWLLLLLALIYYNGCFGLFKDTSVSKKHFAILFLFKAAAVPVIYFIYQKLYGGINNFDSGIYYHDSKALNNFAWSYPFEYLKVLFGLQDDRPGSFFYENCIVNTNNWDNGRIRVFFYNDNRIIIRLHSLLHFIAFNSYFVHALFSCFLSFIGITFIYKSLRSYFVGKEIWVVLILCFFPMLWLHTGALLKEGLTVFVLGGLLISIKKISSSPVKLSQVFVLFLLIFISFLLKPYLLVSSGICFALFFILEERSRFKYKFLLFSSILLICVTVVNLFTEIISEKSLYEIASARQRVFADAAKGGIFLLDVTKFVRLEYDSSLVSVIQGKPSRYKIRPGSPYMYWEHSHQQDTLYCKTNSDTTTEYQLVYQIPRSGSNLNYDLNAASLPKLVAKSIFYSLFYPLFFNAPGKLLRVASFENLLILISFIIVFLGLIFSRQSSFFPLVILVFVLGVCMLVGFTTPNSGAIFRYRSPAVVFIVLAALYYSDFVLRKKKIAE